MSIYVVCYSTSCFLLIYVDDKIQIWHKCLNQSLTSALNVYYSATVISPQQKHLTKAQMPLEKLEQTF